MDCSLDVFEVMLGANVIGIMQQFNMENLYTAQTFTGNGIPVQHFTGGPTLRLRMLMTREQKMLFAVMSRLMGPINLSVDMHNRGKYLLRGQPRIAPEVLEEFAQKKYSDHEVEFILEDASMQLIKEKRHGKSRIH